MADTPPIDWNTVLEHARTPGHPGRRRAWGCIYDTHHEPVRIEVRSKLGPMTEEEAEREADERAKSLIRAAWTIEPRPGHRERVLDALDAADAKRVTAARRRRVWPAVSVVIVAIAAAAVLAVHYSERSQRMVTPGTRWTPEPATGVPPRHREQ